jgi:iron(III) transport system substrate-binding protein
MTIRRMTNSLRAAAAGLLLVGVAACSSSPLKDDTSVANESGGELASDDLEVYTKYADMEEPDRTDALIDAAKEEGSLNLYGTDNLQDAADAFTEEYGIKTTVYEADTDTAVARLTQEAKAGKYIADIIDGGSTLLNELDRLKLLGVYESQYRDRVPDSVQGEHWTADRRQPFVVGYNTDEVDPSEIPDDYLGFADPKWDGKISMELGDYDWYLGLVQYYEAQGMSRDDIDAKMQAIASNAVTADGHSDQAELLAAGQYAVTMSSFVHHIEELKADGAPLSWGGDDGGTVVQPIIMRYEGVALMSHAPHPATATLFMDFLLGPKGTEITKSGFDLPAVPEADDPLDGLNVVLLDLHEYATNGDEWSKEYDALLRNASHG